MNVNELISRFFGESRPVIEVFDEKNIYDVYKGLQETLKCMPDIEISVLQGLAYCFYEVMDNVIIHSGKTCGTVIMEYIQDKNRIKILVADDGIGVKASLSNNPDFADISEIEALRSCIEDRVTSGKGMGFGLFSTACLVKTAGTKLLVHSGGHELLYEDGGVYIEPANNWQGVLVFFELISNREINPDDIVSGRTDVKEEYNETFLAEINDIDKLW